MTQGNGYLTLVLHAYSFGTQALVISDGNAYWGTNTPAGIAPGAWLGGGFLLNEGGNYSVAACNMRVLIYR